jgi:hypothetical protein
VSLLLLLTATQATPPAPAGVLPMLEAPGSVVLPPTGA